MVYSNPQPPVQDFENPEEHKTFLAKHVNAMYKQSAVQSSVCSFNAFHVIMNLPHLTIEVISPLRRGRDWERKMQLFWTVLRR